jgi:hypothetical protein
MQFVLDRFFEEENIYMEFAELHPLLLHNLHSTP